MTGSLFQRLCCKVTDHRFCKLRAHTVHDESCPPDCKTEYYYQCRLCRATFWNYSPPVGRQIPKWYKEQVHD